MLNLTAVKASCSFEDNSIDFLKIHGAHRYEAAYSGIRAFLPKMRYLSIILGHCCMLATFKAYSPVFEGVRMAVDELLGGPDFLYEDSLRLKSLGYSPNSFKAKKG